MKDTILFLPGLLCDDALWAHQVAAFQDTHTCVVADMTKDDSIDGMAERALAQVPETFSLVGLSMGGYTAMAVMRLASERVNRLALLDTSARADTDDRIAGRKELIQLVKDGEFEGVVENHIRSFVHPSRHADEDFMSTIRNSALNVGPDAYVRQQSAMIARPDSREMLSGVRCPTLVLCGAEDALTLPELHDEMAEIIPNANLEKIAGSGHLPTLEKPNEVNDALTRWLKN